MKKLLRYLVLSILTVAIFSSCEKEDTSFDESLLIGKWVSGTIHFKYLSDHNGSTWDTADDVNEEEGQKFTWSLNKSDLTQIHIIEMGGNITKSYTVTELSNTTLKYHDSFGKSATFTKE
jgi:hypothetical protein